MLYFNGVVKVYILQVALHEGELSIIGLNSVRKVNGDLVDPLSVDSALQDSGVVLEVVLGVDECDAEEVHKLLG